jgi:hypothetical protein
MSVRQIPRPLRTRVRVAYAIAWEALVDTHATQALLFIGEFSSRVSPLQALNLYFTVVAVPAQMQEAVRTRTLASLDLDMLPSQTPMPVLSGWRLLRLDLVLKLLQYRRQYNGTTRELAEMVGARAAETVVGTHVNNALDIARLLFGCMSVERAVAEYLRAFYLPLATAQTVMQRAKAEVAGARLAAQYDIEPTVPRELEPEPSLEMELAEPDEVHGLSVVRQTPEFG